MYREDSSSYHYFEGDSWRPFYAERYVSYGDLILLIEGVAINGSHAALFPMPEYLPWNISSDPRSLTSRIRDSRWLPYNLGYGPQIDGANETSSNTPDYLEVAGAYAKITESQSQLQISFQYMIVVISFNILKLSIMIMVLFGIRSKHIVTIGDASASFLKNPDPITEGSFPQDGHGNNSCQIKVRLPRVKLTIHDNATSFYIQTTVFARGIPYSDLIRTDKKVLLFVS